MLMLLIIVINKIREFCIHFIVPNKSFSQLLNVSPKNFIFSKTFDSEFSHVDVWFTDHNFKPLEIENKINFTLGIK